LKTEIALAKEEYTANIEKSKVEMMSVLLEKDVAVLLPKHKAIKSLFINIDEVDDVCPAALFP
jgi:hypothetical protein